MLVSIICPVYNEEKYIAKCLDSILQQNYTSDFEILLIDGISLDNTREIIRAYTKIHSNINLFDNPLRFTPNALNIGINNAKGDIIIRIDAHSIYPANYLETLINSLISFNADNVGCVIKTLPSTNSIKCKAIAYVISHPFGVGNSYFRIGASDILKVDTVPFGCFKKSLFEKIGLFDEELPVNQDDEFNSRILNNGGVIYLLPDITIDYFARDSIYKTIKMFYQYGFFKPLVNFKIGTTTTIRQVFPMLFLLGLCLGPLSVLISIKLFYLYISVIVFYFLIGIYFSINSIQKIREKVVVIMPLVFFLVHVSYGYGYLLGKFKIFFGLKFNKNHKVTR